MFSCRGAVVQYELHATLGQLLVTELQGSSFDEKSYLRLITWNELLGYKCGSPEIDEIREQVNVVKEVEN